MPLWPLRLVGHREQDADVGDRTVGDPVLDAVDDPRRRRPLSAIVFCAAASEPASGSRQREAAEQLAATRAASGTPASAASVPNLIDRVAHERVVDAHDHARRRAGARDLLHREHVARRCRARRRRTPRGPRCRGSRARPCASTSSFGWRCSRSISAAFGSTSFLRELARGLLDQLLLFGQLEIHVDLLALELGGALVEEGRHALPLIRGREQQREAALLERDCRPAESARLALAHDALARLGDRERPLRRRSSRRRLRVSAISSAAGNDRVDEADAQRLVGVDRCRR